MAQRDRKRNVVRAAQGYRSQEIDESKTFATEAREAVRRAKQEGADFVKVHDNLPGEGYFALMDEAKSDTDKAKALFAIFKKNQTWLCPTLIMRHNYASLDDRRLANDSRLKYVKPSWRERWLRMTNESGNSPAGEWSKRKEIVRKEKALVGRMQKAGIGILAGTDDANP